MAPRPRQEKSSEHPPRSAAYRRSRWSSARNGATRARERLWTCWRWTLTSFAGVRYCFHIRFPLYFRFVAISHRHSQSRGVFHGIILRESFPSAECDDNRSNAAFEENDVFLKNLFATTIDRETELRRFQELEEG